MSGGRRSAGRNRAWSGGRRLSMVGRGWSTVSVAGDAWHLVRRGRAAHGAVPAVVPRLSRASPAVLAVLPFVIAVVAVSATASRGWKECATALDMVGASSGFVWTVCALWSGWSRPCCTAALVCRQTVDGVAILKQYRSHRRCIGSITHDLQPGDCRRDLSANWASGDSRRILREGNGEEEQRNRN